MKVSSPCLSAFLVAALCPSLVVQAQFTLQILHTSDLEGGVDAFVNAPNFGTIVEAFETQAAADSIPSILLSAGDNTIPGPFFSAAGQRAMRTPLQLAYQGLFNTPNLTDIREDVGRVDLTILNILGFDASAIGNHEFDSGLDQFLTGLEPDIRGPTQFNVRWLGIGTPYLSANLDFSEASSPAIRTTVTPASAFEIDVDDLTATGDKAIIAPATILEVDGEFIGVVGATTQEVTSLSSPAPATETSGGTNDMPALAAVLQPVIDAVLLGLDGVANTADDVNKVILVSHLQQFDREKELIGLLSGVDVVIAGGSDTILADGNDVLRPGDEAEDVYPYITTNADGDTAVVVSSKGEYTYIGKLVLTFSDDGVLTAPIVENATDANVNGVFATDEAGVLAVTGQVSLEAAIGNSTKGSLIQDLVAEVSTIVDQIGSNFIGSTEVFLEGRRSFVRTEETNLGSLTAEANLAMAKSYDATTAVSIKNGGGIRAPIGIVDGFTGETLPPETGEISQLDIQDSLRFNNGLTLLTVTADELKELIEHGVSETEEGATPGRFAQVAGLKFSYDATQDVGARIVNMVVLDEDGEIDDIIVQDGTVVGDVNRTIRVVTLNFLAGGGDAYPFPDREVVDLGDVLATEWGQSNFSSPGSEQDAFAEYLIANYPADAYDMDMDMPSFSVADTPKELDEIIQDLGVREDTVLDEDTDPTEEPSSSPDSAAGMLSLQVSLTLSIVAVYLVCLGI